MKLMFDVDGVLADFILGFTQTAEDMGLVKKAWTTAEHNQWDFDGLMTKDQVIQTWQYIDTKPGWWATLPPMPDVNHEFVARLNKLEGEVVFCTHRTASNPNAQEQTRRWLAGLGIHYPNVITSKRKGEVARALDVTHAIDDKVENANCIHWISDSLPTRSFIINRGYNQQGRVRKLKVVDTLKEFLDAAERN